MSVRVGINGFGRMGRLALRAAFGNPNFSIVHVNEAKGGPDVAAHLLEFDSVHGRWPMPVAAGSSGFTVDVTPWRIATASLRKRSTGRNPMSRWSWNVRASS